MMRIRIVTGAVCSALAIAAFGCGQNDSSEVVSPATQPTQVASPGGAPSFGEPTGTGYSTGDAIHSDGQGSGLMGYNGTGAAGTSGAITDTHKDSRQAPPGAATRPVLPPE